MKKVNISLMAMFAMSSFIYAGGEIIPVPFEEEVVFVPVEPPVVVAPPPTLHPSPLPPPLEDIGVNGLYVALGLSAVMFDTKCHCASESAPTDKTAGIIARVGYDFNEYIGIEARGIRTNWKSDGGKVKHLGAFLKPMYPVSTDVNIYALGGYAKTTTQGSLRRVNAETFAWGVGAEYDLGSDRAKEGKYDRTFDGYGDQEGGFGLFADYERLVQKSGSPDLDSINVGLTYDF